MAKAAEASADHVDSSSGALQQRQQASQPEEAADSACCQLASAIRDLPHELELINFIWAYHQGALLSEQYVSNYQQLAMYMHFRRYVCSKSSSALLDQLVEDLGKDAGTSTNWRGLIAALLHSLRSVPESVKNCASCATRLLGDQPTSRPFTVAELLRNGAGDAGRRCWGSSGRLEGRGRPHMLG